MTKVTSTSLTHWHDIIRLVNFSFDLLRFFLLVVVSLPRLHTPVTTLTPLLIRSLAIPKKKQFQPPEPHLTFGLSMLVFTIFLLVSAILPFTVGGTHGRDKRGHHQELAQRARGDVGIHKRAFDNARFTFYDVGL
jgi:hypothetical protein